MAEVAAGAWVFMAATTALAPFWRSVTCFEGMPERYSRSVVGARGKVCGERSRRLVDSAEYVERRV